MSKRRRIVRFDSPDIQGEGSWAEVGQLTVKEMRAIDKLKVSDDFDSFDLAIDTIKTHVIAWNWVDDDDKPMPQVPDCPEVVETLTDYEIEFLGTCIRGPKDEELKNS